MYFICGVKIYDWVCVEMILLFYIFAKICSEWTICYSLIKMLLTSPKHYVWTIYLYLQNGWRCLYKGGGLVFMVLSKVWLIGGGGLFEDSQYLFEWLYIQLFPSLLPIGHIFFDSFGHLLPHLFQHHSTNLTLFPMNYKLWEGATVFMFSTRDMFF